MIKQAGIISNIQTIEDLLAHALALETDSAQRYFEMAEAMEVHNNTEIVQIFLILAGFATQHADDIKKRSKGLKIPHIEPWDFAWADGDSPEIADIVHTHSTITAHHVLQSALALEKGAQNFYAKITKENLDKDIILLAAEFAEEENEHVELLQNWVSRYPKTNE